MQFRSGLQVNHRVRSQLEPRQQAGQWTVRRAWNSRGMRGALGPEAATRGPTRPVVFPRRLTGGKKVVGLGVGNPVAS